MFCDFKSFRIVEVLVFQRFDDLPGGEIEFQNAVSPGRSVEQDIRLSSKLLIDKACGDFDQSFRLVQSFSAGFDRPSCKGDRLCVDVILAIKRKSRLQTETALE